MVLECCPDCRKGGLRRASAELDEQGRGSFVRLGKAWCLWARVAQPIAPGKVAPS